MHSRTLATASIVRSTTERRSVGSTSDNDIRSEMSFNAENKESGPGNVAMSTPVFNIPTLLSGLKGMVVGRTYGRGVLPGQT
jgi:hypothetical protein